MTAEKQELSFEEALAELETVVDKLETGELSLADSLAEFETGVKLASFCSNKLEAAEEKVEIIKQEAEEITVEEYDLNSQKGVE